MPALLDVPTFPALPRRTLTELVDREKARARRRRLLLWLGLALVSALAIGAWVELRPHPAPIAARFRMQTITRGEVIREVRATGHVEAVTTVEVGAEISGRIATVEVDYNDVVKQGQVLARFDRASLEAQVVQTGATLAAAKASLEQAKTDRDRTARDLVRVESLWSSRAISDAEHDNAVATSKLNEQRVTAAGAQLAAQHAADSVARTNLEHGVIHAPIAGVVITRNVDPGQTVASAFQTPILFTVAADLRKMRVIAAVDEADIGEVQAHQQATFTVNAYPDRIFQGVVTEVRSSPVTVQDIVTYGTLVEIDNADLALKPGMTASVRIRTAYAGDALRVPAVALHFTPPGEPSTEAPGLWTLDRARLTRVPVRAGLSDGEITVVDRGPLAEGASIVVELSPEGRKAYGLAH